MNIAEKYAGRQVGGTGYFNDFQVKLEGPVVSHLSDIVHASLEKLDPTMKVRQRTGLPTAFEGDEGVFIQVLDNNRFAAKNDIQVAFKMLLRNAQVNCNITTPYFLPPRWLQAAIIRAARRGIKIRIITAGSSDVPVVRYASQHIYRKFMKYGVEFYEMHGATLHAKALTVDGVYSSIGSFNFDLWSGRGNLETNIGVFDPEFAMVLDKHFEEDIKQRCRPVTLQQLQQRPLWAKLLHSISYWGLRLMSPPVMESPVRFGRRVRKLFKRSDETKTRWLTAPFTGLRETFKTTKRFRARQRFYRGRNLLERDKRNV